jgi:hypothetical protein
MGIRGFPYSRGLSLPPGCSEVWHQVGAAHMRRSYSSILRPLWSGCGLLNMTVPAAPSWNPRPPHPWRAAGVGILLH